MKVALSRRDGGVSIMCLSNDLLDFLAAAPDHLDEIVAGEINSAGWQSDVVSWRVVGDDEIPADRTFRNAWRHDGKAIVHDMAHARDIHRDKMRRARKPLLAALDVEFQRGLESGAKLDTIVAKKQALRDVTADPAIEAARTPEELKVVWPAALGGTP
jgi:hypothetical protein